MIADGLTFVFFFWILKVFFSHDFSKSFVKIKSSQLKKGVINLLLKLANGWRPKRSNMYSVSGSSSQLIMQFKVDRFFIICTIDIMKYSSYIQVLKIWDILPLSETPKLIKRLESIFLTYSDDYVSRCRAKSVDRYFIERIMRAHAHTCKHAQHYLCVTHTRARAHTHTHPLVRPHTFPVI